MSDFITGQHLLAVPEVKRFVLENNFSGDRHLVTEHYIRNAFKSECDKIMSNRHPAWFVYEYFD
jgi:hypothetical protein